MEKDCLEAVNVCYETFKIACERSSNLSNSQKASLEKLIDRMDDVIYDLMCELKVGIFGDDDEEPEEETDFLPPHSRN
tara:strand:+ start:1188 stop:1421 length:234 start_codon:yes stop_codon:yes gene_type:complete